MLSSFLSLPRGILNRSIAAAVADISAEFVAAEKVILDYVRSSARKPCPASSKPARNSARLSTS